MDRRELLKMIAVVTGTAVIGGDLFLSGCKSSSEPGTALSAADISLLDEIGETILPATSTPGAKAAAVGEFMKLMVNDCYSKSAREAFTRGIEALKTASVKAYNKSFMDCTPEERTKLLLQLDYESKKYNSGLDEKERLPREAARKENKENEFVAAPRHYYTMMKQLTLLGYFTSRPGSTQALRHVPVPGHYDGALPYKKGDRAFT